MSLLKSLPVSRTPTPAPDAHLWDALIIGAGPAGSVAAAILSARGWRTLLVERSPWPRDKACGGCLNHAALCMLQSLGLADALPDSTPLHRLFVRLKKKSLTVPIPTGAAIARRDLDAHLVSIAIHRGTTFKPQTAARLLPSHDADPYRTVQLSSHGESLTARAKIILAADGLHGTSLAHEPWAKKTTAPRIRLGFSATIPAPDLCPDGTIAMLVAPDGYVGLVRLPAGRLHIGASLNPQACNTRHGPAPVIARILDHCQTPVPAALFSATFTGTGPLTVHRQRVAGHRVLALGDAGGYVEPFTGEGISWAIRSAIEAANLLPENSADCRHTLAHQWQHRHATAIRHRQRYCRSLRQILHRPALAALCMSLATRLPGIPAILAAKIST